MTQIDAKTVLDLLKDTEFPYVSASVEQFGKDRFLYVRLKTDIDQMNDPSNLMLRQAAERELKLSGYRVSQSWSVGWPNLCIFLGEFDEQFDGNIEQF